MTRNVVHQPRPGCYKPLGVYLYRTHQMRFAAFVLTLTLSGAAQAWPTPRAAIEEFLKFELAGGRLDAWDFAKYLAVDPGYDEPGWDMVHLVRSGVVKSVRCEKTECTGEVLFTFEPTTGFKNAQVAPHPRGGNELVSYRLVFRAGQWLLAASQGMPKVSLAGFKRRAGGEL